MEGAASASARLELQLQQASANQCRSARLTPLQITAGMNDLVTSRIAQALVKERQQLQLVGAFNVACFIIESHAAAALRQQ